MKKSLLFLFGLALLASSSASAEDVESADYSRFRFAINGGFGHGTARFPEDITTDTRSHLRKLRSGFQYEILGMYYFSKMWGVGLKYNEFSSNAETEGYVIITDNGTKYGRISNDIRTRFMGAALGHRILGKKNKNCLLLNLGLGYLRYQDKMIALPDQATIYGGTFGTYVGLGYDIRLFKTVSLGFQVAVVGGVLSEVTENRGGSKQKITFKDDERKGLGRVDFSVGLRF